ncbi:DUF742 domain-containing protein [Actinacidiphila rubida]|uniref:DUF742 domain-containing protein n=1 Tax=Actinacidiphila rubida TaxID=310780 RepID=A0A1H8PWP7_9ACTN|nr:DUF742 domain-containing protein [Actinacidiphila rubida]SEO46178.1 Protein of unknown function [Actinacidiphila rubida]
MTRRSVDSENPDRLYTVTGGRSRTDDTRLDLVALIVAESEPTAGMQSEHVRILRLCQSPVAVVELSAYLELPVSVVRILLSDLLDAGKITARHPRTGARRGTSQAALTGLAEFPELPESELLKQVLVGLKNL